MAIRTKLLEVYAKRRDTKGFELLATQLYALTRGEGEDWAKAQELGAQIDPENPLFKPGGAPATAYGTSGEMIEPLGASTMPQSVLPTPSQFAASTSTGLPMLDLGAEGLDLDLGDASAEPSVPGSLAPTYPPAPAAPVASAPSPLEATQALAPMHVDDEPHAKSLDFTLPSAPPTPPVATPVVAEPSVFDLSDISLDLDAPAPLHEEPTPSASGAPLSGFGDSKMPELDMDVEDDPLSRKLELAEEFRQIGDTDGARDLLHEVVAKSSGSVKSRAQSMLADLG
jgi:pilus assembly protein FimV